MFNIGYSITNSKTTLNLKTNTIQYMFIDMKKDVKYLKKLIKKYKYKHIFIHSSFRINIASDFINHYNPSVKIIDEEIRAMKALNINDIVIHCGSNRIYDKTHALNNMKIFVNYVLNTGLNIFLETMCKKNEMLVNLNDYVNFILSFKNEKYYKNLYSCIDTCHIFQAGYNLNDDKEVIKIISILKPIEDKIKLIHLNNSKYECGMRKDFHEKLNEGCIHFDKLISFALKYDCCYILENNTPLGF